ncbi:hypothetical protein FB446DRAFT_758748 [Lentinula raphanica]|nr:hypothetical protein FB446DRAFT_758748 [Lentinula raphanica]
METNKPRRPLPVPGVRANSPSQATQRPATPVSASSHQPNTPTPAPALPPRPITPSTTSALPIKPKAVPASSFYADPRKKDSGPSRSASASELLASTDKPLQASVSKEKLEEKLGSASTTFTNTPLSEDYRAPELIPDEEEPPAVSSVVSEYTPEQAASDSSWSNQVNLGNQWGNQWGNQSGTTAYNDYGWGRDSMLTGWGMQDTGDAVTRNTSSSKIPITNRNDNDELHWWSVWGRNYPGKGALPVLTAESIEFGFQRVLGERVGSKGLFRVEISPPDIAPSEQKDVSGEHPAPGSSPPSLTRTNSDSSSRPKPSRPRHPNIPPSASEIEMAGKPHPTACYSPKENAWLILFWGDLAVVPFGQDPLPRFVDEARGYVRPSYEDRIDNDTYGENCLDYMTGPGNRECHNLTHHFHKYPKSIDGRKLGSPVRHWKDDFLINGSEGGEPIEPPAMDASATESGPVLLDSYACCQCSFYLAVSSPSPALGGMDKRSNLIPGIIPLEIWNAYVKDRFDNPNPSMTREQTLLGGLETLVIIIQNRLWKGEDRNIKVTGKGFTRRLGWGDTIQSILATLSFYPETHKNPANPQQVDIFLRGPVVTPTTREGRLNRRRLIRAWVEISAWIAHWKEKEGISQSMAALNYKELELSVKLNPGGENVRETYQKAIGAHVDQIPGLDLPTTFLDQLCLKDFSDKFHLLGLTPTAWTADLLCFAYLAQVRCDPAHTPSYFDALRIITSALEQMSILPEYKGAFDNGTEWNNDPILRPRNTASLINLDTITSLYGEEASRGRWTEEDLINAIQTLGFTYTSLTGRKGPIGHLNMDWDADLIHNSGYPRHDSSEYGWASDSPEDQQDRPIWENDDRYTSEALQVSIPDEFVDNAWRMCLSPTFVEQQNNNTPSHSRSTNDYMDAMRIIAESRGSTHLMNMLNEAQGHAKGSDSRNVTLFEGNSHFGGIEEAYQTLEVPRDIDDTMLIAIYQMRVEDSPTQLTKMQRALQTIARERNSTRLEEFARTMKDPGEISAPKHAEWPRGLNQLGNTCYLNSLLQYFYTIKELRSSIITMGSLSESRTGSKDVGSSGISDDSVISTSADTTPSSPTDTSDLVKKSSKTKMIQDVTDDDLKKHRVGGRLVTRREIVRSKQFVSHLADLFHKLESADHPSVTPSIELAKLALVTSKDEEEEVEEEFNKAESQSHKTGTDSSHDTDATLVEDLPPRPSHPPPYQSSTGSSSSQTERPPGTSSPNSLSSSSSVSPYFSPDLPHTSPSPSRSSSSVLGKRTRETGGADLSREDTELFDEHSLRGSSDVSPPPSSVASLGSTDREGSGLSEGPPPLISVSELREGEDVVMRDASPLRGFRELPKPQQQPPPLPPRKSAAPVQNDSVMMFGKQHDVAECMDNCMFQIETALLKFHGSGGDEMDDVTFNDPETSSVVKRLFYGKIRQTFFETLKGEATKHEKEDLFSHLPVNVGEEVELTDNTTDPPPYDASTLSTADDSSKDLTKYMNFDIYDGLGRYFDDTIEYEGQYVPMEVGLVKVPPLLQVQLQRVQFNRELLQSWKSQAYVKFGETLYMDRFMDNADPDKRKKSKQVQDELNACRERLKLLTKSKSNTVSFSDALQTTSNFLSSSSTFLSSLSIPVPQSELPSLSSEPSYVQDEIRRLRTRIPELKAQLESIWADNREVEYELTSVFIHRGDTPSFGHYFFYSRNLPDQPDVWFKYNDEEVSQVGKEEVFRNTTGERANPYLLVFARKGSQVIETVNRFDPAVLDDGKNSRPHSANDKLEAEHLGNDSSLDMTVDQQAHISGS